MSDRSSQPLPLEAGVALQPGDIAFVTDRKGRITWWNREAAAAFGLSGDEPAGKEFAALCAGGPAEGGPVDIESVLAGRDFAGGIECVKSGGGRLSLYAYATAGRDQSGEVAGVVFVARDVTGYSRAEEALRASEEKYRRLLDGSNDIVLVTDPSGRIEEANLAAAHLIGHTREELTAMALPDLVAPEGRRAVELALGQMRQRGSTMSVVALRTRTGRTITLELSASLIRVGTTERALLIGRDITERQLAEQRVRESENKYRRIFEASGDAVLVMSFDLRVRDANERAGELFGRGRDELLKLSLPELVVPGEKDWLPVLRDRLTRTGAWRGDLRMRGPGNAELQVDLAVSLLDLAGGPLVLCVGHDVSERRRAEAALRESEARYRAVFDNAAEAVYLEALDGRILDANANACQMTGYTREELKRMSVADLVPPEVKTGLGEIEQALVEKGEFRTRSLNRRRDGTVFPVEVVASALDFGGEPAVLVLVRDISEQQRYTDALRESEARLRLMLDQLPTVLWTVDRNLIFTASLGAGLPKLGLKPGQVVGRSLFDYFGNDSPDFPPIAAHRRALQGETVRYEFEWDGQIFDTTLKPLHDGEGNIIGVIGLAADVTDERRAAAALRRSEERYRSLTEASPDAIYIVDRAGTVQFCNRAGAAALGRAGEDLVGRRVADLFPPDNARRQASNLQRVFETGEPVHIEDLSRYGEREVWLSTWLVGLRDEAGRVNEVLGVSRDLTERKRAEEKLRESEARYKAIFETTAAATMIIEADMTISLANREVERLLGFTESEVVGHKWTEFVAPDELERMQSYHELRRSADPVTAPRTYEARLRHKDGAWRDCLLTVDMIPGTGQSVASVLDVTDRKSVVLAYEQSRMRYRSLLESVPVGIYRTTPDGRILVANPALVRMLGFDSLEELLARNLEKGGFGPGASRAAFRSALESAGELLGYESTWLRVDGQPIFVRENVRVVRDARGAVQYYEGTAEDVTATRHALVALEESEQAFRDLAANINDGVSIAEAEDGRYVYSNPRFREMTGYSEADLAAMTFRDVLDSADRAWMEERFRSRLAGGIEPSSYEITLVCKDGRRLPVEISASVTQWHGRRAVLVSVRDMSARRAAEAALRESEAKYRSVVERASDGICVIQNGRIRFLNNRLAEMVGMTPEQLANRPFIEFVHPEDRAMVADRYRRRLAGETLPGTYSVRFVLPDGEAGSFEINAAAAEFDGAPADVVLVRDVSERDRARAERDAALSRYESLLSSVRDGVVLLDTETRVTFANDVAVKRSGRPLEWWLGRSFLEVVPPEQHDGLKRLFSAALRGEEIGPFELSYQTAGGRTIYIEGSAAAIRAGDAVAGVVVVNRDVTARREAEAALRESEERYRRLVELSPDIIAVHQGGRIVFANPALAATLGFHSADELRGRGMMEFLHPDDYAAVQERAQLSLEQGAPAPPLVERFVARDGTVVRVEARAAAFLWEGKPAVLVIARVLERVRSAGATANGPRRRASAARPAPKTQRRPKKRG